MIIWEAKDVATKDGNQSDASSRSSRAAGRSI